MTPLRRFWTVTPVWIHIWRWNDAQSLKEYGRGALLFFMVIRQISRSHRTKNCRFGCELSVSGLWLKFQFTDGFEMMHKAWCGIEEVSDFKVTQDKTLSILTRIERFYCNSCLNSPMDLKWCTKLDVVQKKCPIVFRGHPSNCTVTQAVKSLICIQFEITRPVAAIKSLRFALLAGELEEIYLIPLKYIPTITTCYQEYVQFIFYLIYGICSMPYRHFS